MLDALLTETPLFISMPCVPLVGGRRMHGGFTPYVRTWCLQEDDTWFPRMGYDISRVPQGWVSYLDGLKGGARSESGGSPLWMDEPSWGFLDCY